MGKSIFELSDKFGYDSPWEEDWVKEVDEKDTNENGAYKLERNAGSSVQVGSITTYKLISTTNAKILNSYNYKWKVLDSVGRVYKEYNSLRSDIQLVAKYPGSYIIQAIILLNGEFINQAFIHQNVYYKEKNTELGGLNVGNFDFYFDGSEVIIEVRVKYYFGSKINQVEQDKFKVKFYQAIIEKWSNSGVTFTSKGYCSTYKIPLKINLIENENDYHKLVDVTKEYRRPKVISDINLYLNIPKNVIAHEFGHVLGLYDEYDGGFRENIMWWHDNNHIKDTSALMNTGTELRKRYFNNILEKINDLSPQNCNYEISLP